jgi:hypothetical protein
MKLKTFSMLNILTILGLGLAAPLAFGDDGHKQSVSVAFGRGLNTAQQGNVVNHAILPDKIKVKEDGVVHFLVAGFHQIAVYNPGKEDEDVIVPAPGTTFINDAVERFYLGILPAGGPPMTPASADPSNARNRVESISFANPGTYLVICNVRGHFLDGMFAYVKVEKGGKD